MDAKICPDGTAVGRSGPNCEFAACPSDTGTTTPNNKISFEIKVVGADGTVVRDWSSENVTIADDDELYIRWNATSYARCLPFLADNGA